MAPQATEEEKGINVNKDPSIEFGKILARPPPGEEIVISGLSGQYPDSQNVYEFRDNLFNKVDMVSNDSRRWEPGHPEIPQRTGKVPNISKFDAGFFGVHHRQAESLDPMLRMYLENVIAAIFDAGLHPSDLEGTNTGVFVGVCFSESEKCWFLDKLIPQGFALTGCERSMLANRVSYFLKVKGPSFICDTACSSSLYAFENAYKSLREGKCDRAIVGGTNLCLHPFVSLQFARLGVLSADGACKVFDKQGDGYARSETVSAIVLQKSKESKRIYATVLHAKTNCDGYKNSGITYPSGEMQIRLLKEFYQECDYIKPTDLSFLEAHGTGTKVGDPEELQAIEEVFVTGRTKPLLTGSIKSNIGHTEPASGLCSITKAIIANETGYIPPNIHFTEPRPECKVIVDGKLKVVTEKTPFQDNRGLIGINSFGFGGGNGHILLRHNPKVKINNGIAKDNIPRLICVSGRTKEAIDALLNDVIDKQVDVEYVRLLQDAFRKQIVGHLYRGFLIASKSGEIARSFKYTTVKPPKLILCFGNINESVKRNINDFLEIPSVIDVVQKLQRNSNGINIIDTLSKPSNTILEIILSNFFIQIIYAELVQVSGIITDKIFAVNKGLSLGILVSAYFDGALSLKEAVECALTIAYAANSVSKNDGSDSKELSVLISKSGTTATQLQQNLTKILSKPRRLSKKVIFDSSPSEISSTYLINSFGTTKVLKDVKNVLDDNYTVYEVGNGEIVSFLKKRLHDYVQTGESFNEFLISIGKLYELGLDLNIYNFFPKVEYPVSRGTPMISPNIKWNHKKDWWVTLYRCDSQLEVEERSIKIMINDPAFSFIGGHVIDGRNLFPAMGYLQLVWETLAYIHGLMICDMKVAFENCRFKRACTVPAIGTKLELNIMIQRGSGKFEVVESGVSVVTGTINQVPQDLNILDLPHPSEKAESELPSLNSKDIYKELRLRGYNYNGQFRALKTFDSKRGIAKITWDGNWITFMDNMLQVKILQEDTRALYVPTGIDRLYIDAKKHLELIKSFDTENPEIPIVTCNDTGIIKCGGIAIKGLNASAIARRKYLATPVLEKYVFVPNMFKLRTDQAVRVNMQILLENLFSIKVKAVELIDDATAKDAVPLGDSIHDALADQPLIQPEVIILSKTELEVKNAIVEDKKLLTEVECSLVVASKLLQRPNVLQLALGAIKTNGFILSREPLDFKLDPQNTQGLSIITIFETDNEQLVLFRKLTALKALKVLKVSTEDKEFTWLPKLQQLVEQESDIIVYAQGEELNGIMGLVACVRREPSKSETIFAGWPGMMDKILRNDSSSIINTTSGQKVKLVFLSGDLPDFDVSLPFYQEQISKNLIVNVFKDGRWGTYRHLLLEHADDAIVQHCYLNMRVRGDLSTLKWMEGPLTSDTVLDPDYKLVYTYYTSLNFRDIMVATAKIPVDSVTRDRREQECTQGFEFSGRTKNGKRVCGMVTNGACSTLVKTDVHLLIEIPDFLSMEEAATIPVVYGTCYYALYKRGKVKRGDTVLIHSGTGGIGQAAITLALHVGCIVYTTVGTQEKREFIKKRFPQLTDNNISSSRDTNFEEHIMNATKGRGVDIVINSLAEEKLMASARTLARGGHFVEIGKFDLANNNELNLLLLRKNATFHGLMLDAFFTAMPHIRAELSQFLSEGMKSGVIRPLNRVIFRMDQAEEAYRFMGSGKHTGKVVIQVRKEEPEKIVVPPKLTFNGIPRYFCDDDRTYIICGGLGGFGLELADWLALRGCKHLILTSRTGIQTGYQAYRISIWKSYGCTVRVSTDDITTYEGCLNLIKTANELAPVQAIFNLAVVIKDAILANQSEETFRISFGPKAYATQYLDEISRKLCPELRDFVVFSSVSCGRGNAGQPNYGMSNSVMEKICEKRRNDGLPGLAIEWGAVGEVGLVAEMQSKDIEIEIGGTLQQRISNCLEVMDILLRQNESAIVSSIVVAEKRSGAGGADNIVDAVANILGVKDLKSISMQATLAEVGMDSMTAVEIKQTLEREYDVFLTAADIKTMTFAKLIDIQTDRDTESASGLKKERALIGMDMVLRFMVSAESANIPVMPIKGQLAADNQVAPTVILFPGLEGGIKSLEPLYTNLVADLVGLQYPMDTQKDTISKMANDYLPFIEERVSKTKPFTIIGYSFGACIALEVLGLLEKKGYTCTFVVIDSSPDYLQSLSKMLEIDSDDKFQISLIVHLCGMRVPHEAIVKHMETFMKLNTFEERIQLGQQIVGKNISYPPAFLRDFTIALYKRLKALVNWIPDLQLKSKTVLFKPTLVSIDMPNEDYGLSKYFIEPVEIRTFTGNHVSILDNEEVAKAINEWTAGKTFNENGAKDDLLISVDKVQKEVPTKL